MKSGYTTGTTAAGAAKAHAKYIMTGEAPKTVSITMPDGKSAVLPVESCTNEYACIIKDAGDDPDVTHGASICASVKLNNTCDINIMGGKGVGVVTKAGLQIPVGKPAINPVPMEMISQNVRQVIGNKNGADVTIIVPDGERLAEQTFNSRIGIIGGISIIGTTGIVEPMSKEALTATIACEIDVLTENGNFGFTLVLGKIGEKHIQKLYPNEQTVMVSNFIGFALDYCKTAGLTRVKLAGHPGKLAKIAMGYYNTHSKESPMAQDFVADKLGLDNVFNTVEEICIEHKMDVIAKLVNEKIIADYGFDSVGVTLFDMAGNVAGKNG